MTTVDDVLQNIKHYHVDFQKSKKKIKQRIKKLNIFYISVYITFVAAVAE